MDAQLIHSALLLAFAFVLLPQARIENAARCRTGA
jgi:hypothetical protein